MDKVYDLHILGAIICHSNNIFQVCVIGSAAHCIQAKNANIPCIDVDGLKRFNKEKKLIKKWAKPYQTLVASESLMKMIPRLLGNVLVKIGKFPLSMTEGEAVVDKVLEIRSTVRYQLKKVLCLATAVGKVSHSEEEIRKNLTMAINFLVSLLKKGW
jgi:large subunit ribosomal protein L10Ae